ncbi:MAG: PKD domain-containing protein, partial [Thermoplasmata archaeon]|nr:PKD domain-containing protein [Thermoplasmata archaeon]
MVANLPLVRDPEALRPHTHRPELKPKPGDPIMYRRSLVRGRRTRPAHRARRAPVLLILIALAMVCSLAAPSVPPANVPLPTTDGGVPWSPDDVGPASPGPDLNASSDDISPSDSAPGQGQSITVSLTVRNTGDEHAYNVTVDLYDGDDATGILIASFHIDNASSGSSTALNTVWTAVLGSHDLTMYLDVDDNVTEDSEVNNEASSTVAVSGVPDVGLVKGAFLISTNQVGSVTLTADGINTGNATASGYRVGFYEGDPDSGGSLIGNMDLSDIPAGERATATTTFTALEAEYHLYARLEKTDPLDPAGNHKVDRKVWFNGAIVSRAGPDHVVMAGQNVTFNGSGSWSVDGAITNYTWNFGDSTTGYGATVTHNYTNPGTSARILNVRLTVRDGSGRSTSDTAKVYVNPTGT